MSLFQGCFFIIWLVFSWKCGWFIRWHHWFGWYLTSSWTRWFNIQCFQRVIWGQGFRLNYNSILCHTDTLFSPNFIHTDITDIWVHQVHIIRTDRVHIYTHFSIMLFTATSYFVIKHVLKMIYLKYMHIKKNGYRSIPGFLRSLSTELTPTSWERTRTSRELFLTSHSAIPSHITHTHKTIYVFLINILGLVDMESNQWVWNFQWVWNVHMS